MNINERFRFVREAKNLNMMEFGKAIGLSHSGISAIEYGTRKVTDKHIKMLVLTFDVNETWLRTGEGNPFLETDASLAGRVAKELGFSDLEKALLDAYLSVPIQHRAGALDLLKRFALYSLPVLAAQADAPMDFIREKLPAYADGSISELDKETLIASLAGGDQKSRRPEKGDGTENSRQEDDAAI